MLIMQHLKHLLNYCAFCTQCTTHNSNDAELTAHYCRELVSNDKISSNSQWH